MKVICKYCGEKKTIAPGDVKNPEDYHCRASPCLSKFAKEHSGWSDVPRVHTYMRWVRGSKKDV